MTNVPVQQDTAALLAGADDVALVALAEKKTGPARCAVATTPADAVLTDARMPQTPTGGPLPAHCQGVMIAVSAVRCRSARTVRCGDE